MKVEDKKDGQNEDKKLEDERQEKSPQNQVSEINGRYDSGGWGVQHQNSDDSFRK